MKYLIINADDFGLSYGVSRGIAFAATNGVVTSTTIMGNMPELESHLELLKDTSIGLGVHLVLTSGTPLTPSHMIPSLVDDQGKFRHTFMQAARLAKPAELMLEWRAQVKRILSLGVVPTHLDSHHHVHMSSKLMPVAIALAKEFNIPAVRRVTLCDVWREQSLAKSFALAPTLVSSLRQLSRSNLKHPHSLIGFSDKGLAHLAKLGAGVYEMVCHPGFIDEELRCKSSLLKAREQEINVLTSPQTRSIIEALGFTLVSYDVLRRGKW